MFKQHLQMIGYNESPNKKAKFWQSYVRSLKGSDDIRANEHSKYDPARRPPFSYIYEDLSDPHSRILVPGYRYLPVHRETYGYSPRPIYAHQYQYGSKLRPALMNAKSAADAERAFNDHLNRMKEIDKRYPSRYGLYLKDKPHSLLPQDVEYEPENKPRY